MVINYKALSFFSLLITVLFICKLILEIISCMWLIKETISLGGDYNIDDYRNVLNRLANICKLAFFYSIFMLFFSFFVLKGTIKPKL